MSDVSNVSDVRSTARAALALAFVALVACRRTPVEGARAAPPAAPRALAPLAPRPPAAVAEPADDDLVGETPESNPTSQTVTIKLIADPARKARVFWGRKDLGLAPLELQRPRGSGPLDLVVVTPGALTLHTRVYTERDDRLALRLFAESEAPSVLGYRPPIEVPTAGKSAAPKRRSGAISP